MAQLYQTLRVDNGYRSTGCCCFIICRKIQASACNVSFSSLLFAISKRSNVAESPGVHLFNRREDQITIPRSRSAFPFSDQSIDDYSLEPSWLESPLIDLLDLCAGVGEPAKAYGHIALIAGHPLAVYLVCQSFP